MKKYCTQIVVVGSGPGGAVASYELKKAGFDVLTVEEGGVQLEETTPFSLEELSEFYRYNGLSVAIGNPNIPYVEGRGVGGGSLINCGILVPTPADILKSWAKDFSLENSNWEDLAPYYSELIKDINIARENSLDLKSEALLRGAEHLGISGEHVLCTFRKKRLANLKLNYLKWFESLGGIILKNSKINCLKKIGIKWQLSGLELNSKTQIQILADYVFLACGAIQTPLLLQRSGIKKNVGNLFQMQPVLKVAALYEKDINSVNLGINTVRLSSFENFKIENSVDQLNHLSLSLVNYKYTDHQLIKNFTKLAHFSVTFKTSAVGKVRNLPFLDEPFVYYKVTDEDLALFSSGIKTVLRILLESGAKAVYPSLKNIKPITCIKDIESIPSKMQRKQLNLSAVHLFGTCPMGEDLNKCVVNSYGKVHEAENLFISDGSFLCSSIGDNPQATIMTFVKRNINQFISTGAS